MAKAVWKDIVLAESDDIVFVEGNVYFPRADVDWGYIQMSDELPLTYCHWKGMAEYYDIFVGEEPNEGAAWAYVEPYPEAEAIAGRVAFCSRQTRERHRRADEQRGVCRRQQ